MEFTATQRVLIASSIALALVAGVITILVRERSRTELTVSHATDAPSAAHSPAASGQLAVHVIGAVQRPGMYVLPHGSRVYDAVNAAGGIAADGDDQAVNLAAYLQDGQQVHIPPRYGNRMNAPKSAPAGGGAGRGVATMPASRVNHTTRSGQAMHATQAAGGSGQQGGASATQTSAPAASYSSPAPQPQPQPQPGPAPSPPPAAAEVRFPLDLNRASEQQLQALPGVGPVTAARIVEHRAEKGGFRRPDDLLEVKGIGPKTLERILPFATVH